MAFLWILIILIALVPIIFIWLPIISKLRAKIVICIASTITAIMMISACIQYSDTDDILNSVMLRNANYIECLQIAENDAQRYNCISNNIKELNEIYWE